jgi:hypothetical protein
VRALSIIRRPFEKFVDSTCYSESELRGGVVTVFFLEVPPMASDALLTTLHPLLENVLQTVDHFEIPCLGGPVSWLEKPRNRMGARSELNSAFGLEKVDRWDLIRTSVMQSRSHPLRFLGFANHEKGTPRQEIPT